MAQLDNLPLWTLVARREIGVRARSKLFLFSTGLILVVIIAGMITLHALSNRDTTSRIAADPAATQLLAGNADRQLTVVPVASGAAARAAVASKSVDVALVSTDDGGTPGWVLVSEEAPDATLAAEIGATVSMNAITANAASLHVPVARVLSGTQMSVQLLAPTSDTAAYQWGLTFAFGLLFFLSCQLFGSTIGASVAEEKESRVVEVLLAAIPVRALLIGKIVGNAALGVAQMALFAAAALGTATAVGGLPHLPAIIASSGWFLLFYLIGFGTVSCLFAGLGALASRTQDLQAATMPVQLLVVATYLCAVIGKGAIVTVSSYIPVLSTVTMPARIFAGTASWWQIAVALVAALVFAVIAVALAVRVYTSSILRTAGRISLFSSLRAPRPTSASQVDA